MVVSFTFSCLGTTRIGRCTSRWFPCSSLKSPDPILQTCIIPVILGLETTTIERILLNVNEEGIRETLIIRKPKVVEIPIKVTDISFDLKAIQLIKDMEQTDTTEHAI